MDGLELLKKDWNKNTVGYKSYSDSDITPMLHKKSSSIVKSLFYISIAESILWILISILPYCLSSTYQERLDQSYENPLFLGLSILSFMVILVFVYLLFSSYKAISTTDNTKKLMESILKTRKVVKCYVLYNLVMIFISIPLSLYFEFNQNIVFHDQFEAFNTKQMILFIGFTTLISAIVLLLFWLFYKLIYGILLKRLNQNYQELKKLEI